MKKCILILDDDEEILFICKKLLERRNYRVETRITCDNIIDDVFRVKPDIILMDLWIPEMGGEKAVSILMHNKDTRRIPVIFFSANAEIEEICKRSSANGYLKKPFEINTLFEVVEKNVLVGK